MNLASQTVIDAQGNVVGYTTGTGNPSGSGTVRLPGGFNITVEKEPGAASPSELWGRFAAWLEGDTFGIPNKWIAVGGAVYFLKRK